VAVTRKAGAPVGIGLRHPLDATSQWSNKVVPDTTSLDSRKRGLLTKTNQHLSDFRLSTGDFELLGHGFSGNRFPRRMNSVVARKLELIGLLAQYRSPLRLKYLSNVDLTRRTAVGSSAILTDE
jgi:hypothetical protein